MRTRCSASRARFGVISAIWLGSSILAAASAQAAGDVAAGRNLFASRCTACHGLNPTRKPGPLLSGVYGRRAGSVPGYHYSTALAAASIVWNASNLDRWLSGPPAFIPGVNMQAKVDSLQDRSNIIAYLKSLGSATATHDGGASAVANVTR
jgi:cytochrome c oxidase assembly protein subunit 11